MARIPRETKQKELIRQELKKLDSFFTAEDLYQKAKKKNTKIGIATVYRLLNELAKEEELHSYLCSRKTVYSNSKNNHSHFICRKCGKTEHIDTGNINFIKKKIRGSICHLQIDVYGVCENCIKQIEKGIK